VNTIFIHCVAFVYAIYDEKPLLDNNKYPVIVGETGRNATDKITLKSGYILQTKLIKIQIPIPSFHSTSEAGVTSEGGENYFQQLSSSHHPLPPPRRTVGSATADRWLINEGELEQQQTPP